MLAKKYEAPCAFVDSEPKFHALMNESEVTGVPSWNVQSLSLMVHVFESSDSMDSATPSACSVVSGSYVIRPVQRASMTSPPLVSDVLVGTSGFSGSPMYSEK